MAPPALSRVMKKGTLNEKCTMKNVSPAEFSAFCIVHFAFRLRPAPLVILWMRRRNFSSGGIAGRALSAGTEVPAPHRSVAGSTTRVPAPCAKCRSPRRRRRLPWPSRVSAVAHTRSEPLEVLDNRLLVRLGQHRPVDVAAVAVARHRGVVPEEPASPGFRHRRDEADVLLIEHVVAAVED